MSNLKLGGGQIKWNIDYIFSYFSPSLPVAWMRCYFWFLQFYQCKCGTLPNANLNVIPKQTMEPAAQLSALLFLSKHSTHASMGNVLNNNDDDNYTKTIILKHFIQKGQQYLWPKQSL